VAGPPWGLVRGWNRVEEADVGDVVKLGALPAEDREQMVGLIEIGGLDIKTA
jgi:hypothetical protein